uniref:PDZ domain-containing protein n=1 Tax=Neolamprologus brichardi TaxID=32507 RepID=A0A3Q4M2A5_NEOBR
MMLDSYLLSPCSSLHSDYIIEEKNAVLQKKENEGFGFVLRGAKAETPIEEFTPTPAFPALQYLESVDVEGVAWRAGLRTGDFLIEVNGVNVVKVGHKQVVSLIRQGGNRLLMKVVSVTRKPETEEVVRKKAPPPPKRAPSTTLTLRSKSMTAELEELGECQISGMQIRHSFFSLLFCHISPSEADYRAATVKQRPTSRRITPAEISVSAPTHSTLADSICCSAGIHTNSAHIQKYLANTTCTAAHIHAYSLN